MASIARAVRIGRGHKAADAANATVRPELFQQPEESSLHDADLKASSQVSQVQHAILDLGVLCGAPSCCSSQRSAAR